MPGALEAEKEERALAVDGVRVDRSSITPIRQAVYGSAAAHLIGYSTPVTKEDRSNEKYAGLSEGTRVGRIGAEYVYDDILRGTDGVEIALRDLGHIVREGFITVLAQVGDEHALLL